jgi:hypothetical protein
VVVVVEAGLVVVEVAVVVAPALLFAVLLEAGSCWVLVPLLLL